VQALLIDMDGTLVETESRWWKSEIDVMERHGSTWNVDDQNQAIGGPLDKVVQYMAAKAKTDPKTISSEVESAMLKSFSEHPADLQPGWLEILNEARKTDLKIALVTASNRVLADALLRTTKLEHYFDLVITSDDVLNTKPHPEPYLNAAKIFNLDVLQCLVFEDSLTGVTSSLGAGMPTIGLPDRVLLDSRRGLKILGGLKGLNLSDLKKYHEELVIEWSEI
jgi:HAD superfamily hydrolase (TIGR01509 family)